MTEWYRHWDVASGVIWKTDGIKNITLIAEYDIETKKWNFES